MRKAILPLLTGVVALSLAGCDNGGGNAAAPEAPQTGEAKKAAGDKTIASGIAQNSRFMAAAKAAGLDATLAGPGPYTVLIPDDAAFAKLPAGSLDAMMKPDQRAQLTGMLTYHILPGTVLAADIEKLIENTEGKAILATMGGGTLEAAKDGDRIVLTDGTGAKSTITKADEQYTNGVVHHVDSVLTPEARQTA
jgi:uncharacterized surface protein with fasciclin (FAS1) repeats